MAAAASELTTEQVVALFGLRPRTVYRWVQEAKNPPLDLRHPYETATGERRLPSVRRGLRCYFQRRAVEAFAKRWGYTLRDLAAQPAPAPAAEGAA